MVNLLRGMVDEDKIRVRAVRISQISFGEFKSSLGHVDERMFARELGS